jgi:tetratricopeptide (TPR) repeat protein
MMLGSTLQIKELVCEKVSKEGHGYLPHLCYEFFCNPPNKDGPEYARMLFYTSREIYYQGPKFYDVAKEYLMECARNKPNWFKERSQAACYVAECHQDIDEKRFWYIQAISLNPVWREPYIHLADLAYKRSDWFGMLGYIKQAEEIKEQEGVLHNEDGDNYGKEFYRLKYLALVRTCSRFRSIGSNTRAIQNLEQALKIEELTDCVETIGHFGWSEAYNLYYDSNYKKAKIYFEKAYKQNPSLYERDKKRFEK